MNPTLDWHRTFVRYEEDGHQLDIPIQFENLAPDVITVNANNLDRWNVPPGLALAPDRRDAIMAVLRKELTDTHTVFTVVEDEYLRRRALPYQVTIEGTTPPWTVVYVHGARRAEFPLGRTPDGAMVVQTSAVTHWTVPAGLPLTPDERDTVATHIRTVNPAMRCA